MEIKPLNSIQKQFDAKTTIVLFISFLFSFLSLMSLNLLNFSLYGDGKGALYFDPSFLFRTKLLTNLDHLSFNHCSPLKFLFSVHFLWLSPQIA